MSSLALAVLLAAAATSPARKADPRRAEARRNVWTGDVALEQARLGMQGLYALATDEDGAWDKGHAQILIEGVERGVRTAATELGRLTNLPSDKGHEAMTDLTRAQTNLARVQSALKNLEGPIKAGMPPHPSNPETKSETAEPGVAHDKDDNGLPTQIKQASKALDDAISDFKKVADDYKVTTRLPTP